MATQILPKLPYNNFLNASAYKCSVRYIINNIVYTIRIDDIKRFEKKKDFVNYLLSYSDVGLRN